MDEGVFDPYLRKSNKDKHRSVERQFADMTEGAAEAGIQLGERVFVDPDLSAPRFARRGRAAHCSQRRPNDLTTG